MVKSDGDILGSRALTVARPDHEAYDAFSCSPTKLRDGLRLWQLVSGR